MHFYIPLIENVFIFLSFVYLLLPVPILSLALPAVHLAPVQQVFVIALRSSQPAGPGLIARQHNGQSVELTADLSLVPRLKLSGALSPHSHTYY
jgi:hypothetical protein